MILPGLFFNTKAAKSVHKIFWIASFLAMTTHATVIASLRSNPVKIAVTILYVDS